MAPGLLTSISVILIICAAGCATSPVPTSATTEFIAGSSQVAFAGINIAGFDFGCTIDGTCNTQSTFDVASQGTGLQQMQHFVQDDGLNAFRLPVAWQYLVNNNLGGPLDPTNSAAYDKLVMGCVNAGAKMCIIDIHNYARYNGLIIAQDAGGPTNEQYTSLLSQLAAKYANVSQVAFDIMNEPHDIPSLPAWANSSQLAVNAIRAAGATTQQILIPGTNFTSATAFASTSGPVLLGVKNPDGTTDNLLFNVHQYLDSDASGTHSNCVMNNIDTAFTPLAAFLRQNNRTAILTETGGGPTDPTCLQMLCQQNDFIKYVTNECRGWINLELTCVLSQNSDVFKGVISWAAGGFDSTYVLTETPTISGSTFTDQQLVTQCIVAKFKGASGIL